MGRRRRKSKPSTDGEKAMLLEYRGVWDKQCEDCRWVYVKFFKQCPKCESTEWDLVGRVSDPDRSREADPSYTPTPEEIRQQCEEIRKDWDEDRLKQQERFRHWQVPASEINSDEKSPGKL